MKPSDAGPHASGQLALPGLAQGAGCFPGALLDRRPGPAPGWDVLAPQDRCARAMGGIASTGMGARPAGSGLGDPRA